MRIVLFLALALAAGSAEASPPWLRRAMSDVGTNPTGWSHKWCGRYIDMVVPGGWSNKAIENRHRGRPTFARPGAIAVMSGHIGIVGPAGCSKGRCQIISGNHAGKSGRRTVGWGYYSMSRIVAFRWPH